MPNVKNNTRTELRRNSKINADNSRAVKILTKRKHIIDRPQTKGNKSDSDSGIRKKRKRPLAEERQNLSATISNNFQLNVASNMPLCVADTIEQNIIGSTAENSKTLQSVEILVKTNILEKSNKNNKETVDVSQNLIDSKLPENGKVMAKDGAITLPDVCLETNTEIEETVYDSHTMEVNIPIDSNVINENKSVSNEFMEDKTAEILKSLENNMEQTYVQSEIQELKIIQVVVEKGGIGCVQPTPSQDQSREKFKETIDQSNNTDTTANFSKLNEVKLETLVENKEPEFSISDLQLNHGNKNHQKSSKNENNTQSTHNVEGNLDKNSFKSANEDISNSSNETVFINSTKKISFNEIPEDKAIQLCAEIENSKFPTEIQNPTETKSDTNNIIDQDSFNKTNFIIEENELKPIMPCFNKKTVPSFGRKHKPHKKSLTIPHMTALDYDKGKVSECMDLTTNWEENVSVEKSDSCLNSLTNFLHDYPVSMDVLKNSNTFSDMGGVLNNLENWKIINTETSLISKYSGNIGQSTCEVDPILLEEKVLNNINHKNINENLEGPQTEGKVQNNIFDEEVTIAKSITFREKENDTEDIIPTGVFKPLNEIFQYSEKAGSIEEKLKTNFYYLSNRKLGNEKFIVEETQHHDKAFKDGEATFLGIASNVTDSGNQEGYNTNKNLNAEKDTSTKIYTNKPLVSNALLTNAYEVKTSEPLNVYKRKENGSLSMANEKINKKEYGTRSSSESVNYKENTDNPNTIKPEDMESYMEMDDDFSLTASQLCMLDEDEKSLSNGTPNKVSTSQQTDISGTAFLGGTINSYEIIMQLQYLREAVVSLKMQIQNQETKAGFPHKD